MMITVQETTVWENPEQQNHQYILTNDRRYALGYIKHGEKYPQMFSKPMRFDARNRSFTVLVKT